jgi:rhamnogalacturonyl hydrolase YesR
MDDPERERQSLRNSIERVEKWVESHFYQAYEPFDGLSSPLLALTFNNHFAERVLQQIVKRSPLNIRPIIGIKPQASTKGRGYMAWGYLNLFRQKEDESYKRRAVSLLDWLDQNKSPYYSAHSWGNHFPFSGRTLRTRRLEPIIVWTSLIGQVFLDAYELLAEPKYLEISKSVCDWIMNVPKENTPSGLCLSYVAFEQVSIHNANLLGAAMLARTGILCGNDDYLGIARRAVAYSCSRQREDGSWYYAEAPNCHWIDNFHTGYNLDSLKCYKESTGDNRYDEVISKGFRFFIKNFFKPDGMPKYYHNKTFPIDIQCASQAIDTLATFGKDSPESLDLARKVARWTIDNMQGRDGHFYYKRNPLFPVRTAMLHWGQATMYKALTTLMSSIRGEGTRG